MGTHLPMCAKAVWKGGMIPAKWSWQGKTNTELHILVTLEGTTPTDVKMDWEMQELVKEEVEKIGQMYISLL